MSLLVTGAGGLLGRACARLASRESECLGLTRQDLDVTDRKAVERALGRIRPTAVLHCAALTDVDGAERDPASAMAVNAEGTEWVARAAREIGALMVYVSTDYVFDGNKRTPYTEDDEPRPLSHYGLSKLEGERRVADICPSAHLIVRSGWLYGVGKGFVHWVLGQLDEGASISLIDDQVGSPTWVQELAEALLLLIEQGHSGVFHVVNKGETHWLGAARAIAECMGLDTPPFERASIADWVRSAPRPRYSALNVGKFEKSTRTLITPWNQAIANYLSSVGRLPLATER